METTKRIWKSPVKGIERFMPNEYCAVCVSLACEVANGNDANGNYHRGRNGGDGCGNVNNQIFRADGNNVLVTEVNVPDGNPDLECIFTEPAGLTEDFLREKLATQGSRVEVHWVTRLPGYKDFLHYGYITRLDDGKGPGHS